MSDEDNQLASEDQIEGKKISMEEGKSENKAENQRSNVDDEESGDKNLEQIASDKRKNKSAYYRLFGFIILVLICVLIGGGYHLWNELQQTKVDLVEVTNNGQAQTGLMAGNIAVLEDAIKQLELKQIEQSEALASLYKDKRGNNEDWALAEVEYLLIIAMHRLLLEEDVATALAAMEAADLRLRNLRNPGLLPVRQQLASDINQLRSVNLVDIAGLAIYLADLVELSDDLLLKSSVLSAETEHALSSEANYADVEDPLWKKLPKLLWQEIKSLVVIKRSDEVKQALLLPGEEYFLTQNLKLELESARQSVLRSDSENLRASIDFIQFWLRQYFDTSDSAVVNVMETLDKMRSVELKPALPDISSSLESLRAYVHEAASEPTTGTADVDEIQYQ
ncbi:MAG: uroporphyrinogen-III C-methyltransferase [Proteobacteria bacterium]|nr:uroporphyrinogen-III C-methyltransferase [Pseudomonadota bacterium]